MPTISSPAPSLFSTAPQPLNPTAQFSAASGVNLGGLPPGAGLSNLAASLAPSQGAVWGSSPTTSSRFGAPAPPMPNVPLPTPMSTAATNQALAGMKVQPVSVPLIDPKQIINNSSLISDQDVKGLSNTLYQGQQALVAPTRNQQNQAMREQLSQAGLLNSPAGLSLEKNLQQEQIQQDDAMAAQATQTATEVQLSREQTRTSVYTQVELANQQAQMGAALQTQQLQAEMAAQKSGLQVQALTTQFNQQLAVSQLALQSFFDFGNLTLGVGTLSLEAQQSKREQRQQNIELAMLQQQQIDERRNAQTVGFGIPSPTPNYGDLRQAPGAFVGTGPSRFSPVPNQPHG